MTDTIESPADAQVDTTEQDTLDTAQTPIADDSPATDVESSADATSGGGTEDADASSGIDTELASLAGVYGYDLKADPQGTGLTKFLATTLHRELASLGQQHLQGGFQQPPPPQAPAAQDALDLEKLVPELPEGDFDPAIVGYAKSMREALKSMHSAHVKELAALKDEHRKSLEQEIGPLKQARAADEQRQFFQTVDGFFGKSADKYGAGATTSLSPYSPQAQTRNKVLELAVNMHAGFISRQQQPPELDTLLKWADDIVFADQKTTAAVNQIKSQLKQNGKAALSGANGKTAKPLTPKERAAKVWTDGMRKAGFAVDFDE